jgi:hypothetical protein
MRGWRDGGFTDNPRRDAILLAIAEHDNGWREVDVAPIVDEATGRIHDFVSAPDPSATIRSGIRSSARWKPCAIGISASPGSG